jgi:peptide/nickel transport system substrate-binding protein
MNDKKRGLGRIALYLSVIGALVVSIVPASSRPAAAQQQNCRTFTVAGQNYNVCGRILEEWSKQGSEQANVYVNGLPITNLRNEISLTDGKTYQVQWFERARFELHPENQPPYDVLLGLLGVMKAEGRGSIDPATGKVRNPADQPFVGIDKPADADGKTKVWFPETRHSISGKILEYWNRYGGLKQFGFPLSEAFQEVSVQDGKTYTVQYFERNRFELHPEKQPPYEVELGLLGSEQYKATPIPASELPIAKNRGTSTSKTTLVAGSSQEPANLTIFNNALINSRLRRFVEVGLTDRDDSENVYPQIAWYVPTLENGGAYYQGVGDDRQLVVKYKLRRGIKWSDGVEVTSNDAIFLFRLIMHPDAPVVSRAEYQKLQNVDNPDKYTAIYYYRSLNQLKAYYNSIPDKEDYGFLKVYIDQNKPAGSLTYSEVGGIYPMHVLQNINPADIPESPFATTPIGAGPWKVQSWTKGQEMVLVPNPNYNLTPPPLITTIRVKFITDVNQLIAQAKAGELDMIFGEAFNAPPADRAGLEAAGFKIVSRPAATWEHVDFYFDYAPFKEKAVREAIYRAINRQRISDVVYAGTAGVQNSVVPPGVWHSLENPNFAKEFPDLAQRYKLPDLSYDPNRARQLLDQAGWRDTNGNGTRDKNGVELSFEYATTTQAIRQQIQALVSADLKAVGVDAVAKNYPASVFFAEDDTSPRNTGQTKFAEFAWVGSSDSDFSAWTCDQVWDPVKFTGQNSQRYCNRDVDIANGQYNAASSRKEIAEASAKAQQLLANDIVVVPLVTRANIEVVRASLQNFVETNSQVTSNWNAVTWYFR